LNKRPDLPESSVSPDPASQAASVRVIDRTMRILRTLAEAPGLMTLTELSHAVGLHKSTVLRFLRTMEQGDFVASGPGGKGWRPGPVFLDIRARSIARHDLAAIARPLMEEACRLTGETVQLAILPDTSIVYLAKVEPLDPPLRINTQVGARRPIHCTGLGKVLAAYRDRAEMDRILAEAGLPAFTSHTITTAAAFHAELAQVRLNGYAIDDREYNELVSCIAAPVRNSDGIVVAALSMSSFGQGVKSPRFPALIEAVRSTATRLSELLGWNRAGGESREPVS
jgi:IclR family acetate operon transcriptional repressor